MAAWLPEHLQARFCHIVNPYLHLHDISPSGQGVTGPPMLQPKSQLPLRNSKANYRRLANAATQ